jgi:hypothetical protein
MLFLIPVFALLAADTEDPWKKVRDLKTGAELRIIKAGAAAPVMAKFAELTEENLVVILKNEQIAIPRDKVARIDSRPQKSHLRTESKMSTVSDGSGGAKSVPSAAPTSSTSYSTGVAISDKIDFETIYRRAPAAAPAKK